jgi:hypothetical protein
MKSDGAIHVLKVNFACLYFELQHFLKLDSIVMILLVGEEDKWAWLP